MKRVSKCIACGRRLAATPALNVWTRKGPVHVGCIVAPSDDHVHTFDAGRLVVSGHGPTCRECGWEAPRLP